MNSEPLLKMNGHARTGFFAFPHYPTQNRYAVLLEML